MAERKVNRWSNTCFVIRYRWWSSGSWRLMDLSVGTSVSEEHTASIFRTESHHRYFHRRENLNSQITRQWAMSIICAMSGIAVLFA
jgi:hypothetical protein